MTDNSHLQYWNQQACKLNMTLQDDDRYNTTINERKTIINLNSFKDDVKNIKMADHTVYTDGGKTKTTEGVGLGFVVYDKNKCIHSDSLSLPNHATVFKAKFMLFIKQHNT